MKFNLLWSRSQPNEVRVVEIETKDGLRSYKGVINVSISRTHMQLQTATGFRHLFELKGAEVMMVRPVVDK